MDKLTREDLQSRLEQYKAEKNFSDHHISIEPDDLIDIIETALALMDEAHEKEIKYEAQEELLKYKNHALEELEEGRDVRFVEIQKWNQEAREQHEALRAAVEVIIKREGWRDTIVCLRDAEERVLLELLDGKVEK